MEEIVIKWHKGLDSLVEINDQCRYLNEHEIKGDDETFVLHDGDIKLLSNNQLVDPPLLKDGVLLEPGMDVWTPAHLVSSGDFWIGPFNWITPVKKETTDCKLTLDTYENQEYWVLSKSSSFKTTVYYFYSSWEAAIRNADGMDVIKEELVEKLINDLKKEVEEDDR